MLAGIVGFCADDICPPILVGVVGVEDAVRREEDLVGGGDDGFLLTLVLYGNSPGCRQPPRQTDLRTRGTKRIPTSPRAAWLFSFVAGAGLKAPHGN